MCSILFCVFGQDFSTADALGLGGVSFCTATRIAASAWSSTNAAKRCNVTTKAPLLVSTVIVQKVISEVRPEA